MFLVLALVSEVDALNGTPVLVNMDLVESIGVAEGVRANACVLMSGEHNRNSPILVSDTVADIIEAVAFIEAKNRGEEPPEPQATPDDRARFGYPAFAEPIRVDTEHGIEFQICGNMIRQRDFQKLIEWSEYLETPLGVPPLGSPRAEIKRLVDLIFPKTYRT